MCVSSKIGDDAAYMMVYDADGVDVCVCVFSVKLYDLSIYPYIYVTIMYNMFFNLQFSGSPEGCRC